MLYADEEDEMGVAWRFHTETCLRVKDVTWLLKDDVIADDSGRPVEIHIRKNACPETGQRWRPKSGKERIFRSRPMPWRS